jgi:hypothetical protein
VARDEAASQLDDGGRCRVTAKRSDQGPRQSGRREAGLRGGVVLVDDPTEHVATADVAERRGSRGHCAERCGHFESKAAVRPMLVVMPDVVAKDGFEMTTAEKRASSRGTLPGRSVPTSPRSRSRVAISPVS